MRRELRIVFMGTPDFAVASLDALYQNGYKIVAVVTAPDKPAGRGNLLHQSAVKKYALEKQIPVLQPEKLRAEGFLNQLRELHANLFVVVAFRMLPEIVWSMPELGTFNLHASLLPQYRGAAPINWAVINGEMETGVTTFFLQQEIDTGNIILQEKIKIADTDNAGTVHDKLMQLGADLVLRTVKAIEDNAVTEQPQQEIAANASALKHAPKIFKETCKIDWNQNAEQIHNLIRGLSPYPAAFTFLDNKSVKVYASAIRQARAEEMQPFHLTANIYTDKKTFLSFSCADLFLDILEIQLEGKKKMKIDEFLRGHKFSQ